VRCGVGTGGRDEALADLVERALAEDLGGGDLTSSTLLSAERVALNLLGRLSGVATLTARRSGRQRLTSPVSTPPGPTSTTVSTPSSASTV